MAKCAKSVGDIFLSEGVTFSSVWFSCFMPHGAVASEPVQTESAYMHRSEDVCYRIQLNLYLLDEWTKY